MWRAAVSLPHDLKLLLRFDLSVLFFLATLAQVMPASGELPPRSSTVITVEFTGIDKKELAELVKLEVGAVVRRGCVCQELLRATQRWAWGKVVGSSSNR